MTLDEARALVASVSHWHHRFEIYPGLVTPGTYDPTFLLDKTRLAADLRGLRVLDIGTSDGFFALQLARRGAEVIAIDYRGKQDHGYYVMERLNPIQIEYHKISAAISQPPATIRDPRSPTITPISGRQTASAFWICCTMPDSTWSMMRHGKRASLSWQKRCRPRACAAGRCSLATAWWGSSPVCGLLVGSQQPARPYQRKALRRSLHTRQFNNVGASIREGARWRDRKGQPWASRCAGTRA